VMSGCRLIHDGRQVGADACIVQRHDAEMEAMYSAKIVSSACPCAMFAAVSPLKGPP
jgi:hypothetical protein